MPKDNMQMKTIRGQSVNALYDRLADREILKLAKAADLKSEPGTFVRLGNATFCQYIKLKVCETLLKNPVLDEHFRRAGAIKELQSGRRFLKSAFTKLEKTMPSEQLEKAVVIIENLANV